MNIFNKNFPNIFIEKGRLYVKTDFSNSLFDERIVRDGNNLFREWDPKRSKLAAALMNQISQIGFKEDSTVLYLGASHGYTPSFVSDIVAKGFVFAVEIAPIVARDLVIVCEERRNMIPILASANHPKDYETVVSKVDIVYQDISQKNQVEIFLKNCDTYLKQGGFGLLALKDRSIDVTKQPRDLYKEVKSALEKMITVVDFRELQPFEKDHGFFIVKKR